MSSDGVAQRFSTTQPQIAFCRGLSLLRRHDERWKAAVIRCTYVNVHKMFLKEHYREIAKRSVFSHLLVSETFHRVKLGGSGGRDGPENDSNYG